MIQKDPLFVRSVGNHSLNRRSCYNIWVQEVMIYSEINQEIRYASRLISQLLFLIHKVTSELLYIGADAASVFSVCVNIRTQNLRKNRHGADVAQYRHHAVFLFINFAFRQLYYQLSYSVWYQLVAYFMLQRVEVARCLICSSLDVAVTHDNIKFVFRNDERLISHLYTHVNKQYSRLDRGITLELSFAIQT